jgi:diacylglycerol kinase (CTP)
MSQQVIMPINSLNFKVRSDLHLTRKVWHVLTVLMMSYIYAMVDRKTSLQILAVAMLFFIGLDVIRLRYEFLNRIAIKVFGMVMRRNELNAPAGTTYLLSGVFIIVAIFPHEVVLLTLLFLALADPIASYFGIRFGKDKIINNKSLQGTLAAFVVCTLISYIYFQKKGLLLDRILLASLISGIIGALSELLPIRKMDDNLTFPILCSFALFAMFNIFS